MLDIAGWYIYQPNNNKGMEIGNSALMLNAYNCRGHYIEYLGGLITKNKIDPLILMNEDELELILKRAEVRLPLKPWRDKPDQYRKKLLNVSIMPLKSIRVLLWVGHMAGSPIKYFGLQSPLTERNPVPSLKVTSMV